ncbi:hypothetical protein FA15DRAFT_691450 [Coprinopsis marcescibilis]|uniref:Uncharacterized protein n=1 Tax=Coprinopsis marcescibilis TaxID=230819 RepID=A0A5C3LK02_COPMA|nr:hypothetical protein FA15DRAFT_691450 [Coprinopsis marcescibilis]
MVFGFFRKSTAAPKHQPDEPAIPESEVAGSTTAHPPFVFPDPAQRQLHTPAPSISFAAPSLPTSSNSPPPPQTPSPPPAQEEEPKPHTEDPRALHALIKSVPAQTLHDYCLKLLDPTAFDTVTGAISPKRRGKKKAAAEEEHIKRLQEHPVLTPPVLTSLTGFFQTLEPPPQLHCARCHKSFFELENDDTSCRVPHDDDSTIVDRVGTRLLQDSDEESVDEDDPEWEGSGSEGEGDKKLGRNKPRKSLLQPTSIYETLWRCCDQVVEGDGDQGPPDGWCFQGHHTTDLKRARFRADSSPHDDKLSSCEKLKCFTARPPVSQASTVSDLATRKRKRKTKSIDYREVDDDEDLDDGDDKSVASSTKRRRKDSTAAPKPKGKGRKKAANKEATAEDAMDVDAEATQPTVPRSPPASPRRNPPSKVRVKRSAKPLALAETSVTTPSKPISSASTKPANPSPLGTTTFINGSSDKVQSAVKSHRKAPSNVFVEIRQGSRSPSRSGEGTMPAPSASAVKRAPTLKSRASVASLRSQFESSVQKDGAPSRGRKSRKSAPLGDVVGSSVDNEVDML